MRAPSRAFLLALLLAAPAGAATGRVPSRWRGFVRANGPLIASFGLPADRFVAAAARLGIEPGRLDRQPDARQVVQRAADARAGELLARFSGADATAAREAQAELDALPDLEILASDAANLARARAALAEVVAGAAEWAGAGERGVSAAPRSFRKGPRLFASRKPAAPSVDPRVSAALTAPPAELAAADARVTFLNTKGHALFPVEVERGYLYFWTSERATRIRLTLQDGRVGEVPLRGHTGAGFKDVHVRTDAGGVPVRKVEIFVRDKRGREVLDASTGIELAASTPDSRNGGTWRRWMDAHLREGNSALDDRAALYGFLMSLFRHDWRTFEAVKKSRHLDMISNHEGALPEPAAVSEILAEMEARWRDLGLEKKHGAFEYWLMQAAVAHVESPMTLWRYALQAMEGRPRAAVFMAGSAATHLRGIDHPVETFGDPGAPREGYIDVALMVEALPAVVTGLLDRVPAEGAERDYWLWTLAAAIAPDSFHGRMEQKIGRVFPDRAELRRRLAALGRPEELRALFAEIRGKDWARLGLVHPWVASDSLQTVTTNHGDTWIDEVLHAPAYSPFARPDPAYHNARRAPLSVFIEHLLEFKPAPHALNEPRGAYRRYFGSLDAAGLPETL